MRAFRVAAPVACALALGACAMLGPGSIEEGGPGVMRAGAPTPAAAATLVTPGNTKQQVSASMGHANVIHFDSGWEVWVYRWPGADRSLRGATEFVVLFDAQGVVRKVRLRRGGS